MEDKLKLAGEAFEKGDLQNGIAIVDRLLEEDSFNTEALMLKAIFFYKQQKWGDALNALSKVQDIEPNHQSAIYYRQMINSILTYWNKDNYNP